MPLTQTFAMVGNAEAKVLCFSYLILVQNAKMNLSSSFKPTGSLVESHGILFPLLSFTAAASVLGTYCKVL